MVRFAALGNAVAELRRRCFPPSRAPDPLPFPVLWYEGSKLVLVDLRRTRVHVDPLDFWIAWAIVDLSMRDYWGAGELAMGQ